MNLLASNCSDVSHGWLRIGTAQRLERLGLGLVLPAAMAATPWWLERQLSLGCVFRSLTGLPCPLCGGTHACAAWVQGDWAAAWAANPGAVGVLLVMTLMALQWTVEAGIGWRRSRPWPWSGPVAFKAVLAGLLGAWVVRLVHLF